MKLSFISPTPYIKSLQSQSDFILALSHLIDNEKENEYEKAIKETGLQIILDNGLFENGKPEAIDSLLRKAVRIGATHFFAPDHLYNSKRTIEALEHTIHILKNQNLQDKIKIAAVVQAEDEEDYFRTYDKIQTYPEVDLIGLSILTVPRCFGLRRKYLSKKDKYEHNNDEIVPSRITLMKKMIERGNNNVDCHLLGLGNSYEDVKYAKENCPWIISNDTSSPVWNGFMGQRINENGIVEGGKTKIHVDFDYNKATEDQIKLAQENINNVKKYLYD